MGGGIHLKNYEARKAEFYMKALSWYKGKLIMICAPEEQMEMKCILYFYVDQGYSGERCGPWASCLYSFYCM
jgi:hypothetical protein